MHQQNLLGNKSPLEHLQVAGVYITICRFKDAIEKRIKLKYWYFDRENCSLYPK